MTKHTNRPAPPQFFRRYGPLLLIGMAVLVPLMGWGSIRALRSNRNDVKSWLPAAYEETATFGWYWKHFEGDAFILASWDGCVLANSQVGQVADLLRKSNRSPSAVCPCSRRSRPVRNY